MKDYTRRGAPVRAFRPDEDARIEDLRIGGMSLGRIAREVGRGKSAVQQRLDALARRAEAAEDAP